MNSDNFDLFKQFQIDLNLFEEKMVFPYFKNSK
jgi:hypothetical protein